MNNHKPRCRSCKQEIVWAETEKGRRIPLDPKPARDGNIILHLRGRYVLPLAIMRDVQPTDVRYKSHFATCPQADQFRKKK